MTPTRHCQLGFHSCDQVIQLQERIEELEALLPKKNGPTSRQVAEKVFASAKTAFTELDSEPEDVEGAIQEIEGILEREARVPPDAALKAAREKNEREGLA